MKIIQIFLLTFLCAQTTLFAAPMSEDEVPEALKPWVNWVLHGEEKQSCPQAYNSVERYCAWPSRLNLQLDDSEGHFSQDWQIQDEAWVRLPGDKLYWPQGVTVDDIPAAVVPHNGFPAVQLTVGKHQIAGSFEWDNLPESLMIPPATGLIEVSRNGELLPFPRINKSGRLWLDKSVREKDVKDTLEVQVFRKIADGHPLRVETRIVLNVSGRSRDLYFANAQIKGLIPLSLNSLLPARVSNDGRLHVQVRPGNWTISLLSRGLGDITSLSAPSAAEKWPAKEIWVFAVDSSMRLVEVNGATSVDSRQTRLPQEWYQYPAYLMEPGQTMRFKVTQRGRAEPEPNRLSLERQMWLDFDGKGYTMHDRITGNMTRDWRLDASADMDLGLVRTDGKPRFITTLPDSDGKGVELRYGRINLEADSRYLHSISNPAVTGWKHDFQNVNTTLYLPAGWKLFSAHGADNIPRTWLQSWTLLDLFLVLITAVAVGRLWGWQWGLFALLTLALVWHEADAPRLIWLNIVAAVALLRVLPEGWPKKLVWGYRNISFLVLLLIALPFAVDEVRIGLFPQLGVPGVHVGSGGGSMNYFSGSETSIDDRVDLVESQAEMMAEQDMTLGKMGRLESKMQRLPSSIAAASSPAPRKKQSKNVLNEIDPNANIQTGPGLSIWQWRPIYFEWSSPVEQGQSLKLVMLSPIVNLILNFLRVLLVLVLTWRLVDSMISGKGKLGVLFSKLGRSTPVLLLPALLISIPLSDAKADIPDQEMLETLRQRLLKPVECLPNCAQIGRMRLELSEKNLLLRLKVSAIEATAIPLPGNAEHWLPTQVLLDDNDATALIRSKGGELWLGVGAGLHEVILQGRLPRRPQIQLSLPLRPHYVEWQGQGWVVEGIRENHSAEKQLQLVRQQETTTEQLSNIQNESSVLPPLLRVERTLQLGLDWSVVTQVTRLSPVGSPVSMQIPLLPDESVLSDSFTVKQGRISINLGSNQKTVHWKSHIPVTQTLQLKASAETGFVESWTLDISPVWHVEFTGIPGIHDQSRDTAWLPKWNPWPDETLQLAISRPEGIQGRGLTIDRSVLNVSVGKRVSESTLSLNLRASQGGQHSILLPENAELLSVSINNKIQPVRQREHSVTLPITPGKQSIDINWREALEIGTRLRVSAVNLGTDSVNSSIQLSMGQDRWILLTGGPRMGPAVMFWGVLLVILLASIILGRINGTPLKTWHWFLLGVGLSLASPFMIILVVGWLFALRYRPRLRENNNPWVFNSAQIALVILTLIAFGSLIFALQQGLLGWPNMQISGNGSSAWSLNWYQDRAVSLLPQPWVISVPLLAYRLLMLAWALWLAFALLGWLRWGWDNFSEGGLWRKSSRIKIGSKKSISAKTESG